MRLDIPMIVGADVETPRLPEITLPNGKTKIIDYIELPVCATFCGGPESRHLAEEVVEVFGRFALLRDRNDTVVTREAGVIQVPEWQLLVTGEPENIACTWLWLTEGVDKLVAHNGAFDWTVIAYALGFDPRDPSSDPKVARDIMALFEDEKAADSMVREMLDAVAKDRLGYDDRINKKSYWSLADVVKARFGEDISAGKKDPDAWRLKYGTLQGVPAADWPPGAAGYAMMDPAYTRRAYLDQAHHRSFYEGTLVDEDGNYTNEGEQTAAALWGHWMECVGLDTDPETVREFSKEAEEGLAKAQDIAARMGFLRRSPCKDCHGTGMYGEVPHLVICPSCQGVPKGAKAKKPSKYMTRLKDWVSYLYGSGAAVPRTEKGNVKTDNDTLTQSGDENLVNYANLGSHAKMVSTYVPILRGAKEAGGYLRYNFNPLVATGRTSKRGPNMQNPPRDGLFRECFVPRPGTVWASVDYSSVEMCTLAQVCLELFGAGSSKLANAINSGMDPHIELGRKLLTTSMVGMRGNTPTYAEALAMHKAKDPMMKKARQFAKVGNFGLPGGLGTGTLADYGRKTYGVKMTSTEAEQLKYSWLDQWPEMVDYFAHISNLAGGYGERFRIQQLYSNRLRGGCTYTSGCNTLFQGLAADGAKYAGWLLWKAMLDPSSVLYGCRMVLFIHDEFVIEGPEETAHLWAEETSRIMVEAMKVYVPDVEIKAPPALMRRWYKDADPVYVDGKLVPWEPT